MNFLRLMLLPLALGLAGCGALTDGFRRAVATEIGTAVHIQVGTAAVEQVGTAVATHLAAPRAKPTETPGMLSGYDCAIKTCGAMTDCAEAVYKLTVCQHSQLDGNDDGVPCQAICSAEDVAALSAAPTGEIGRVTRVIDGDTIDVLLDGQSTRIRYLQMNTPERDHPCYHKATEANAELVAGKTVRLVADTELVDPFDRLLRYVYVGDLLVNRVLVEQGYAEVVLYPPNDKHYEEFKRLEAEAAAAGRGCHPSGIFADGSSTR